MKTRTLLIWSIASCATVVWTRDLAAEANAIPEQNLAVAIQPLPPPATPQTINGGSGVRLSSWASEVAKLAEAGLEDFVLEAFIDCAGTFNLNSEQIIYLRDSGVSNEVISTMLRHDLELGTGLRQLSASAVPPSPAPLELKLVPKLSLAVSPEKAREAESSAHARPASESVVNEIPESDAPGIAVPVRSEPDSFWTPLPPAPQAIARSGVSPVRQPYAVELTDPILVFRGSGRSPNIVLVVPLPQEAERR